MVFKLIIKIEYRNRVVKKLILHLVSSKNRPMWELLRKFNEIRTARKFPNAT
ncbi:hypothetical protein LEP1GSC045_4055 [Leptospira interrogans serovar Pomona str. Kennewicki LC82-25]|nr:hypothetical protein LEP1GSC045_4055 [Leptospira interrogans serovar Pomona str. Kennewicki LC82-25]EKN99425.1 hypothetical protein LEP1GSC014_2323 [Leptospira interrogans serovar Pomona str. Pomona]EMJ65708.1 hypothetical protein LEP1GSC197_2411 [Leptospira interrogans serovar Pomona str. CSL4002]